MTMMLATDPRIVRFPAKVVARAITFHISSGEAKLFTHFPATRTKGTLEKIFEPAAENQAKFHAWDFAEVPNKPWILSYIWSGNPVPPSPSTTTKREAKNTSKCQS